MLGRSQPSLAAFAADESIQCLSSESCVRARSTSRRPFESDLALATIATIAGSNFCSPFRVGIIRTNVCDSEAGGCPLN